MNDIDPRRLDRVAAPRVTCYRVPALERGLRLLQLFNGARAEISFAEAARDLRLPRTSVYRIMKTLEFMGYLRLVHGVTYALGPAVLRIGAAYSAAGATGIEVADPRPAGVTICARGDDADQGPPARQMHDGHGLPDLL